MSRLLISLVLGSLGLVIILFLYLSSDDESKYLVFGTWGTPNEIQSFQSLIDSYNSTRNPKHKVKLFHPENVSYDERLLVQAAAGDFPDVVHLSNVNLPSLVRKGLIEDLGDFVRSDTDFRLDAFFPKLVQGCIISDRLYGIPHNFSTMVVYYNKDHFDAEGIQYPESSWTWDTLLEAAKRLTKRDQSGKVVRYGCYVQFVLTTFIEQNGGSFLDSSLDHCTIDSPEAVETLQFYIDLSEKHGVTWNFLNSNLQFDDMFAGGRCSMIANGRWAAAWYSKSMMPGSMDVAPLPHRKFRIGGIATHMMCMSANSNKKDEAWDFIKFLVSEKAQVMVCDDGNNIPALRRVAESDLFLKNKNTPWLSNRVFLEEIPYSTDWPYPPNPYVTMYAVMTLLGKAERDVTLGQETSFSALRGMKVEIDRIIAAQKKYPEPRRLLGSFVFYLAMVCIAAIVYSRLRKAKFLRNGVDKPR